MEQTVKIEVCPFCFGEFVIKKDVDGRLYPYHENPGCPILIDDHNGYSYGSLEEIAQELNQRPVEEDLRRRIAELEGTFRAASEWMNKAMSTFESQAEGIHLVEDGNLPDEGQMVLWTDGAETFIGGYAPDGAGGWFRDDDYYGGAAVAWIELPDLLKLAEIKRAKGKR